MDQASLKAFEQDAEEVPSHDAGRITRMGDAMCAALDQGDAVMCIATGTQRRLLERQLTIHGVDVLAALVTDQFVALNARETLSKILFEGVLDVIRFTEAIGALVDRTTVRYPRVVMFGELVRLERARGEHAVAIKLDSLWRRLAPERPAVDHPPRREGRVSSRRRLS